MGSTRQVQKEKLSISAFLKAYWVVLKKSSTVKVESPIVDWDSLLKAAVTLNDKT